MAYSCAFISIGYGKYVAALIVYRLAAGLVEDDAILMSYAPGLYVYILRAMAGNAVNVVVFVVTTYTSGIVDGSCAAHLDIPANTNAAERIIIRFISFYPF
jgi:hypothetical protein